MNILAFDQGTTSSRAILFNDRFEALSSASQPIEQIYPAEGYVEHSAEELFSSVLRCAAECLYGLKIKPDAIGITNQRETVVVWERATGRPIHNAIVWQCRRTADACEKLKRAGFADYIKEKTGLPIDAYFSATKISRILDTVPGARESAERGELACGTVDSWLIYRLTGNHLTDVTNASRTMLYDIINRRWDKELCRITGVPECMLPEVVDSAHDFGSVRRDGDIPSSLWGVHVLSALGDQQASLFGLRCFSEGDVKNTYGTGCFTLMNTGALPKKDRDLITTPAWSIGGRMMYALEGSVFNAGSAIQWLRDSLGIISRASDITEAAERSAKLDNDNVMFVSAFTGLGAPYWDMYTRAGFVGITRATSKDRICRAVLEGIAFQVYDLVRAMETSGVSVNSLTVDGGASASDYLMKFQAGLLDLTITRPDFTETTALGAAFMAAITLGAADMDSLSVLEPPCRKFSPSMSEEQRRELLSVWQRAVAAIRAF